jgi:hypothetical protein
MVGCCDLGFGASEDESRCMKLITTEAILPVMRNNSQRGIMMATLEIFVNTKARYVMMNSLRKERL